ncbi:hypothetical protein K474DRAFT_1665466 [Panus rudis PR-1116 ss-1]|nr:hypothetical protein K474DRAFT_1665466 [Panus rudis PR-1116 ss-1]
MTVAVAIWSVELQPGQTVPIQPPVDLRITNVALGDTLADESARTSVKLVYRSPVGGDSDDEDEEDDEEESEDEEKEPKAEAVATVLCSLTPGKIEQCTVDVVLEKDEEYLLESVGKNTVFITGNYIDQGEGNDDESEFDYDPEEDDYDLRDVSSDVEVDPEDIDELSDDADRFEEINDEEESAKDSKKRPRESDAMETDEPKLSKSEKKKLNKKLKAENGAAVPAGTTEEAKKEKKKEKKEEKKEEKKDKKEKKDVEKKVVELPGGLKYVEHKVGEGREAKKGDKVSVRYVGKLQNGKIFDQNTKGKPFTFTLGAGEVIKGWDVGVAGMKIGGERALTVPPALGYGKQKQGPIPPNSTLTFEVKLLKIN